MQGDLEGLGKSDVEYIRVCVRFREFKTCNEGAIGIFKKKVPLYRRI